MAKLIDLPTETLTEIVWQVSCWRGLDDLSALRLTSHKLRDITDLIFFNTLKTKQYEKQPAKKILQFADIVSRRPELRKSVKTIDLFLGPDFAFNSCRRTNVPNDFDLSAIRKAAEAFFEGVLENKWVSENEQLKGMVFRSKKKKKKMKAEMKRNTIEVYPHVAALVSLLPRLEVLRQITDDPYRNQDMGRIAELKYNYDLLRELVLEAPERRDGVLLSFGPMAPLLELPRLNNVSLKYFDLGEFFKFGVPQEDEGKEGWEKNKQPEDTLLRYAKGSLAIQRLRMRHCSTTNEYMVHLIAACRRLKCFDFKTWADIEERDPEELDVKGWHEALSIHKYSLKVLSLNCISAFKIRREYNHDPLTPWPSFAFFTALKDLRIEYRRMKYAHLPPSIETLYLFDCRDVEDDDEITAWTQLKANHFPHIKTFEIMVTGNCRGVQYQLKYYGFHWGCWTPKTREWEKDGFLLKVWFKDFIDGTYYFSQGTDDTGDIDSQGNKIKDSDEEEEDEDEERDDDRDQGKVTDGNGDDVNSDVVMEDAY
ncbi:hypothetical protein CC80DRAFT_595981 [Byssothecium circinans]|uniref:F-box domain-containing protein n=1 Tax=Byssothecium circinans TaxID=147558 RepID=A0A6A5TP18_9PLEO|nr:hypothetical protein CC80DRAFT_595981 [Byssothecium circinans]